MSLVVGDAPPSRRTPFRRLIWHFRNYRTNCDAESVTTISGSLSYEEIDRAWRRKRRMIAGVKVLAFPILIPWKLYREVKWRVMRSEWYDRKLKENKLKRPKVVERKRALSPPLEETSLWERKRKTKQQEQCLLLRLPFELRLMIWEQVLGECEVYVLLKEGRLTSFRLEDETEEVDLRWYADDVSRFRIVRLRRSRIDVVPLLQTCRLIYSEVTDLLYRRLQFSFCDVYSFLAFSAALVPKHFDAIQHIYMAFQNTNREVRVVDNSELSHDNLFGEQCYWHSAHRIRARLNYRPFRKLKTKLYRPLPKYKVGDNATTWDAICTILNEMAGLKSLKMVLSKSRFNLRGTTIDEAIYGPLRKAIERVDYFDVVVEWHPSFPPGPPPPPPPPLLFVAPLAPPPPPVIMHQPPVPIESARGRLIDGEIQWRSVSDDRELILDFPSDSGSEYSWLSEA